MAKEFWFVWVEGRAGPMKQHFDEVLARAEAERLGRQRENIRLPVHVLRRIATCCVQTPLVWDEED